MELMTLGKHNIQKYAGMYNILSQPLVTFLYLTPFVDGKLTKKVNEWLGSREQWSGTQSQVKAGIVGDVFSPFQANFDASKEYAPLDEMFCERQRLYCVHDVGITIHLQRSLFLRHLESL